MALVYINTSVSASFCQNAGGFSSAQPAVARTARQERASWLGSPLVAKAKLAWQPRRAHKSRTVAGLNIDRRAHLEKAWRDQEEQQREAELADVTCPVDCVREVYNLAEFEAILLESEKKNELVVVDFYNPSCGACKFVLPQYISLCKEGAAQETAGGAGAPCVRFVKHNIENEYAERTDIAFMYRIKGVPSFAFFKNGAKILQFATRNPRNLENAIESLLENW